MRTVLDFKREFVKCVLCGQEETKPFLEKETFKIVKCCFCGLIYVNPRLKRDVLESRYKGGAEENITGETCPGSGFVEAHQREFKNILFEDRIKIIHRFSKAGKILDVGCSYGYFLEVARKYNWRTSGVELSEEAVKYACNSLGLNVYKGTINDLKAEKDFDVITMWHVLEHVPDPVAVLNKTGQIYGQGWFTGYRSA